jgi:branched-chain amino acid transport system ATP-binding protein
MENMLLEIKDLRVRYKTVEALKGISLGVEEGTIVTLIGANGAGKSTTLRTLSGLIRPFAGEIRFKDQRIEMWKPANIVKAGIAHVPEGGRLFTKLTVIENLRTGAYLRKDKARVKSDLDRVYHHFPVLKERQRQKAGTLSGGERQMLAFGRALMNRPKLLLLDEPSLGLSPILVDEIFKIIETIKGEGITVLLVEQNARKALELADRAYVFETGRVFLEGDAEDLLDSQEVKRAYLGG